MQSRVSTAIVAGSLFALRVLVIGSVYVGQDFVRTRRVEEIYAYRQTLLKIASANATTRPSRAVWRSVRANGAWFVSLTLLWTPSSPLISNASPKMFCLSRNR